MGNSCVGPNLGANGFLQSVSAAVWRTRPPEDRLPPPNAEASERSDKNVGPDSSKAPEDPKPFDSDLKPFYSAPPMPVQSTPPETVKITPEDEPKQQVVVEPEKPIIKPEVKAEVKEEGPNPSDDGKPKKPSHVKRLSSAGLQMESVLGRKTGNIKEIYSLGRKLGQGQFGTTFFCIEKESGKEFACKSIAKRKLTTEEDVEDVRREIQIMHHLAGHPNVIQIVGAYEDAVAVHVVMELCAGGELFDRIIQRGHYTERRAAQLARLIVGVVEACHSLGVMHRDLKPENFLFVNQDEDAPLKTIDFGLSIFFRPGTFLIIYLFVLLINLVSIFVSMVELIECQRPCYNIFELTKLKSYYEGRKKVKFKLFFP